MKIIIAGGRDFKNQEVLNHLLDLYINPEVDEIVSGDARGVDTMAAEWGAAHNAIVKHFPASWNLYGSNAGYIRNAEMGEYADKLIAIWDGKSPGTKHMIQTMKFRKKPCKIFSYDGELLETKTYS